LLLLLWGSHAFAQGYSSGISESYRVRANVTYLRSGVWEGKVDEVQVPGRLVTLPGGMHGGFSRAWNEMVYAAIEAFLKGQDLWPTD